MPADEQLVRQPHAPVDEWPEAESLPVESKGLVEGVMERVAELIEADILSPGDKLPSEKRLMQAFRVGRTSVREALRSLVAMHILDAHPGKGYFVSSLAPSIVATGGGHLSRSEKASVIEMMEAREKLEIAVIQLAIARADPAEMRELEELGAELRNASEQSCELLPYTMRIHLAIAAAAHNKVLLQLFHSFIPWIMSRFERIDVPRALDVDMHLRLLEAFMSGDENACVEAVQSHQEFWMRQYQECSHGR